MKLDGSRNMQAALSGLKFWLVCLAIIWIISSVGLWWLVKSFIILIGLLFLLPIVGFIGFRFWLQRNLVNGSCPVCSQAGLGLANKKFQCMSCGESLIVLNGEFRRVTPPGTVDVDVVDVSSSELPD